MVVCVVPATVVWRGIATGAWRGMFGSFRPSIAPMADLNQLASRIVRAATDPESTVTISSVGGAP